MKSTAEIQILAEAIYISFWKGMNQSLLPSILGKKYGRLGSLVFVRQPA